MNKSLPPYFWRIVIMGGVFLLFLSILVAKLWIEQIHRGPAHRDEISRQSIRRIRIPAMRGRIYTSDGHLMADNIPSYDVIFHLAEMRKPGRSAINYMLECAEYLAKKLGRKCDLTEKDIITQMNIRPGLPMTVFQNLSSKELGVATELTPPIPGMEIIAAPVRHYPEGRVACHLIGYTGVDDPQSADDRSQFFYYIPDKIGRGGVEKKYDEKVAEAPVDLRGLRGTPGKSVVRIDHLGFVYETIGVSVPPIHGNDITLTLDYRAQTIAEKLLEGERGALVLLDADNGAVLAMASSPGYDLKEFVPNISTKIWEKLNTDKSNPLLNRATMGSYTPGSILKPLIALSILKSGVSPQATSTCRGAAKLGKKTKIRCWSWRSGGHGVVDVFNAIKGSCNVYFIEKGTKVGLEKIAPLLSSAGVGSKTGFALPERSGLLPSREFAASQGQRWNIFHTALLSMGQGMVEVTPLQAAVYTAAIANGGTLWRPFILKSVKDAHGNTLFVNQPGRIGQIDAAPSQIAVIREGMRRVINATDGTAKKARNSKIILCGKTGSAEVGSRANRYVNTWFIAFGEKDGKRYAIAVVVEKGQSGGRTSAPIVGKFFEEWL